VSLCGLPAVGGSRFARSLGSPCSCGMSGAGAAGVGVGCAARPACSTGAADVGRTPDAVAAPTPLARAGTHAVAAVAAAGLA
jgi:hypothetical protein